MTYFWISNLIPGPCRWPVRGDRVFIESDPGDSTSLTRRLGIKGLELVELYDIEPWAVDHLQPHDLIFCFLWKKDSHWPGAFNDPAAEKVWFATQLSDDACATHAILNVVLNCPGIDLGDELGEFKRETEQMTPVMRGLAITNSPTIRHVHNLFARPSDLRASLNNITITTFAAEKEKELAQRKEAKPPPAKRAKLDPKGKAKSQKTPKKRATKKKVDTESDDDDESDKDAASSDDAKEDEDEAYHFIGYVPAHGKVWELDGLKSGPLEVGELPAPCPDSPAAAPSWMDTARPALRMKMERYGGSGNDGSNIRFSLLAIVDDAYIKASDEWELCKRERVSLERRMREVLGEDLEEWRSKVDADLLLSSQHAFALAGQTDAPGRTFAVDFGARKLEVDKAILSMTSGPELTTAWKDCVRRALRAKISVEDERTKAIRANTDHVKRTFDYEPFIRSYISALHSKGLLNPLLDRDEGGRKLKAGAKAKKAQQSNS